MNQDEREVHDLNPAAHRGRGGIWNEDTLPVTEWENPVWRVVLPQHLQERLELPVPPVLRWDAEKIERVLAEHSRDQSVIRELTRHLDRWAFLGSEEKSNNHRVLFADESGRWYAVTLGELQGSHNIVTVFSGSARRFLNNRLRGMEQLIERGE